MNQTTNKTQTTGSSVRTRHMVQTAIFGVIIVDSDNRQNRTILR